MKYSIRGHLSISDGVEVVELINQYFLWKLDTHQNEESFSFEVWLENKADKNSLFEALKPFVDSYGETIDWHECRHDEQANEPCEIAEVYRT